MLKDKGGETISKKVFPVSEHCLPGFNNLCGSEGVNPLSNNILCGSEGASPLSKKKMFISVDVSIRNTHQVGKVSTPCEGMGAGACRGWKDSRPLKR